MRKGLFALLLLLPFVARAEEVVHYLDFQSVVDAALADGQLDGTVKFYLRGQPVPGEVKDAFPEAVSSKKSSTVNKGVESVCELALRAALASFQKNAKRYGANAVVDLVSFYRRNEYSSASQYECYAAPWSAGMALKGHAVILR